ncbi:MAG: hypothetical protein ABIE07_08300 [Candidatus Zixiibacteriota bacterium]
MKKIIAEDKWTTFAGIGALILICLLRVIAVPFSGARIWGFNHLQFLPDAWLYIYLAAGLAISISVIFALRGHLNIFYERLANLLFKRYFLVSLVISIIGILIFWFLRMPTNLLGDGYSVINNIGGDLPVVFKWSEAGAVRIIYWVSRLLPFDGLMRGEYAFAIVSVLSGAATVFLLSSIVRHLCDDRPSQLMIWGTSLFSGSLLLFFGYAENYPVLWPLAGAYILASIRYLKGKGGILIPALLILLGIYLHLQMIFFALSFPVLIFSHGAGQKFYRKNKKTVWMALIILSGIFIYLFIHQYYSSIAFRSHILPLWQGKPLTPDYAIISVNHLIDIINLFLLTVPLWPILIIFIWKSRRSLLDDAINRFLFLFSMGGLIFLLIIDPRLGMARDWDLFALTGLGPILLLTRIYVQSGRLKFLYPIIIAISFAVTLPYLATNLKTEPSLAYMQSLLELDKTKSRSGLVMLRDYLHNNNDKSRANQINDQLLSNFPQTRWEKTVKHWINNRVFDKAFIYADSIYNYDPYSVDAFNIYSHIYLDMGKYDSALAMVKISTELSPYESRAYTSMAIFYRQMKNYNEMWKSFRRAQKLNPREYSNLMLMSQSFANDGVFDSAIAYIDTLKNNYSDSSECYLAAGMIYRAKGEYDNAVQQLEMYAARLEDEETQINVMRMIEELKNMQK